MDDIRDVLFEQDSGSRVTACIFSDGDGVLSGVERAAAKAAELGLAVNFAASEGAALMVGDLVMELCGSPKAIAQAEDRLMGLMLKPSGIATAASRFVHAAGNMRIVCGSWKKLPYEMKPLISEAVTAGGAGARICEEPMVYLDKNYVEMLGGIQASLRAADKLEARKKVVQIRGRYENGDIVREAFSAISAGADIVFVDTGRLSDIRKVCEALGLDRNKLEQYRRKRIIKARAVNGQMMYSAYDLIALTEHLQRRKIQRILSATARFVIR